MGADVAKAHAPATDVPSKERAAPSNLAAAPIAEGSPPVSDGAHHVRTGPALERHFTERWAAFASVQSLSVSFKSADCCMCCHMQAKVAPAA